MAGALIRSTCLSRCVHNAYITSVLSFNGSAFCCIQSAFGVRKFLPRDAVLAPRCACVCRLSQVFVYGLNGSSSFFAKRLPSAPLVLHRVRIRTEFKYLQELCYFPFSLRNVVLKIGPIETFRQGMSTVANIVVDRRLSPVYHTLRSVHVCVQHDGRNAARRASLGDS